MVMHIYGLLILTYRASPWHSCGAGKFIFRSSHFPFRAMVLFQVHPGCSVPHAVQSNALACPPWNVAFPLPLLLPSPPIQFNWEENSVVNEFTLAFK